MKNRCWREARRLFLLLLMIGIPIMAQTPDAENFELLSRMDPGMRAAVLEAIGASAAESDSFASEFEEPDLFGERPEEPADSLLLTEEEPEPSWQDSLLSLMEALEPPREAFLDLLGDSRPPEISTDLPPFGYDLFSGVPSTFAPATDIPVPADYVIGPGDEIRFQFYGKSSRVLDRIVDRDGLVALPDLGPFPVSGLRFDELRELLARETAKRMIGTEVSVTLGRLRSIRVFVLGEVFRPGSYTVSGLSTLSHALLMSGGVTDIGSLRRLQLKRGGELVTELDLYDLLLRGDNSGDLRLLPGDVVFVPVRAAQVGVAGEVLRPAFYEPDEGQTVLDLVNLAGGFRSSAWRERIQLDRSDVGGMQTLDLDFEEAAGQPVQDGDMIKVFALMEEEEKAVYLTGNFLRPGKRGYREGMRLSDLLSSGDLLPETWLSYALLVRENERSREPEYRPFHLGNLLFEGDSSEDLSLLPRDRVMVFPRSSFTAQATAVVVGEVQYPGEFPLVRDMKVQDLLLAAGGLSKDAWTGKATLSRRDSSSRSLEQFDISLSDLLSDGYGNLNLQDLDTLRVHSVWEFAKRKEVEILGEVHLPGVYPYFEGMRVSDLLYSGGNLTEEAYLRTAELTRFSVVDGTRRELERLELSLEDILAGKRDADLLLQAHDNLLVRRLSNWRGAERVRVTGEVAFPGSYPIEEGERLSDLLERVGGFLPDAYLPAAVFTRESVRQTQQEQLERMSEQLEGDLVRYGLGSKSLDSENDARKKEIAVAGKQLVEELRETRASGRLVIQLKDLEKLRVSEFDLLLQNGDHLHVPKLN
ncbi:MAG: SLBB domain-containing protein, partial [Candidatus Krumholzibacteria bacterium]|nr:SLBB domain-containing protein [Candidatus Krumholzibacteria bacterium]